MDGGGVVPDQDLGDNARITFLLPGAEQAVTVWAEDDVLHIAGQYRGLHLGRVAFNHITVTTYGLGKDRTP